MKTVLMMFLSVCLMSAIVWAQDKAELEKGINYIETQVYTQEENEELLQLYKELRVADVSDGMDAVGLPGVGLVDPSIHPDWQDFEDLSHQFRGIAITVRYVPTQKRPLPENLDNFSQWEGEFYTKYSHEAFTELIEQGSVVVIDDVEEKDIGSIGSYNILAWHKAGAVGVVTDASSRDTDEIAKQQVPLYLRHKGRGIRPGRNEIESVNRPVSIGGVLVCPGDVVVADGDGVVVVPRRVAKQVAEHAQNVLKGDKAGRRSLYESMGLPLDQTVQ